MKVVHTLYNLKPLLLFCFSITGGSRRGKFGHYINAYVFGDE